MNDYLYLFYLHFQKYSKSSNTTISKIPIKAWIYWKKNKTKSHPQQQQERKTKIEEYKQY